MKITVSGKIGAGKTTVCKKLARRLKLKYLSTGNVMRALAKEKSLSMSEFLKLAKQQTKYHKELDIKTIKIGKIEDNFVFDSRLAFYFIPKSVKIFLTVTPDVAARRIFRQKRKNEKENVSLKKTKEAILQREKNDMLSFKKIYGINHHARKHYDLVIDTSKLNTDKIVDKIVAFLIQKRKL